MGAIMRNCLAGVMLLCLLMTVSACTSRGVEEFQLYSTAFDLQNETAQRVLDKVASAERGSWSRLYDKNKRNPRFNPDSSAYYVNVGDPPFTGSMRQSMAALKLYNDALVGLANGETADALVAKITSVVTNLTGAITGFESNSVKSDAQLLAIASPVAGYLTTAKSILGVALKGAARQSFRDNLIKAYPYMQRMLLEFRKGSQHLYFVVISQPGVTPEQKLKDRELFASWVLLIDSTLQAMEAAVTAAMLRSPATDLDALAEYSIELRVLAEKIRAERNR